jgi:hypothetical protein
VAIQAWDNLTQYWMRRSLPEQGRRNTGSRLGMRVGTCPLKSGTITVMPVYGYDRNRMGDTGLDETSHAAGSAYRCRCPRTAP